VDIWLLRCEWTDRHTDTLIAILCMPLRREVMSLWPPVGHGHDRIGVSVFLIFISFMKIYILALPCNVEE